MNPTIATNGRMQEPMKKPYLLLFAILAVGLTPAIVLAQAGPSITIVKPVDRHNVALGKIDVTVRVSPEPANGDYTWQMFVDGVPEGMVRGGLTTSVTIEEPSGPHRLRAELYDAQGNRIASNEILVMAAPTESQQPVFNREWFAPVMAVFVAAVIGLIFLGLKLHPRAAS